MRCSRHLPALLAAMLFLPTRLPAQDQQAGVAVQLYDVGTGMAVVPLIAPGQRPNVSKVMPTVDLLDRRGDFGDLKQNFVTHLRARLTVAATGWYTFRLSSDDGSLLWLDGRLVLDHDGPHGPDPKQVRLYLVAGSYPLAIDHYQGGGGAMLKLEWQTPGSTAFELVPAGALTCAKADTATASGRKRILERVAGPVRVTGVHPGWQVQNLCPAGFQPAVVGLGWDGTDRLLVLDRTGRGALWLVTGVGGETPAPKVERLLEGVAEPVGLEVTPNAVLVLTRVGLLSAPRPIKAGVTLQPVKPTTGGAICGPVSLREGVFAVFAGPTPEFGPLAGGRRHARATECQPRGLVALPDGSAALLAEQIGNAGLLSSAAANRAAHTLAVLPEDVVRTPTQPVVLTAGPFAGQVVVGDITLGGLRRVALDPVGDTPQGCLLELTQGLSAGPSRLLAALDGSLIVGCDGGDANWGEFGRPGYGLERLRPTGTPVFEIKAVRARRNGFQIEFTEPLAERAGWHPGDYRIHVPSSVVKSGAVPASRSDRWPVRHATVAADRRSVFVETEGDPLVPDGYVTLDVDPGLRSEAGRTLWSTHAWYTARQRSTVTGTTTAAPEGTLPNVLTAAEQQAGWRLMFDGETPTGWRGFRQKSFPKRGWEIADGLLHSTNQGGGDLVSEEQFANFEFQIEWKATRQANSGLMFHVTEQVSPSFATGPEVQILDDGRPDSTEIHSAGSLYELYAPKGKRLNPAGEWNHLRLVVNGAHCEHWLNGTKIVEYDLWTDEWNQRVGKSKFGKMPRFGKEKKGHLVIQDHGSVLWFRNLKVKVLPD